MQLRKGRRGETEFSALLCPVKTASGRKPASPFANGSNFFSLRVWRAFRQWIFSSIHAEIMPIFFGRAAQCHATWRLCGISSHRYVATQSACAEVGRCRHVGVWLSANSKRRRRDSPHSRAGRRIAGIQESAVFRSAFLRALMDSTLSRRFDAVRVRARPFRPGGGRQANPATGNPASPGPLPEPSERAVACKHSSRMSALHGTVPSIPQIFSLVRFPRLPAESTCYAPTVNERFRLRPTRKCRDRKVAETTRARSDSPNPENR